MAATQCSECDEEIEIAIRPRLGQKVVCNHCGAQLEVVATDPLEVESAQEEENDPWEEEMDELDDESVAAGNGEEEDEDEDDDFEVELEIEDDFEDDDFEDDLDDFDDDDDEDFDEDDDGWG